jgi:hypothetical protein
VSADGEVFGLEDAVDGGIEGDGDDGGKVVHNKVRGRGLEAFFRSGAEGALRV